MASVSFRIDDQMKARLDRLVAEKALNPSAVFRQALETALSEIEFGENDRRNLKLSLADRVKLANQYEILSHLDSANSEQHQAFVQLLKQGFDIQYGHLVRDFSDGLSDAECAEVLGILDMHSVIRAFLTTSNSDIPPVWEEACRFRGFEETSENGHHAFARFLIYDINHYPGTRSEVERFGLSSTVPMLPRYRRMLDEWLSCRNRYNPTYHEVHNIISEGWGEEIHG